MRQSERSIWWDSKIVGAGLVCLDLGVQCTSLNCSDFTAFSDRLISACGQPARIDQKESVRCVYKARGDSMLLFIRILYEGL